MIKTALKHVIYELCISTFFDNIKNNFTQIKQLQQGNHYRKVILQHTYAKNFYIIYNVLIEESNEKELTFTNYTKRVAYNPIPWPDNYIKRCEKIKGVTFSKNKFKGKLFYTKITNTNNRNISLSVNPKQYYISHYEE